MRLSCLQSCPPPLPSPFSPRVCNPRWSLEAAEGLQRLEELQVCGRWWRWLCSSSFLSPRVASFNRCCCSREKKAPRKSLGTASATWVRRCLPPRTGREAMLCVGNAWHLGLHLLFWSGSCFAFWATLRVLNPCNKLNPKTRVRKRLTRDAAFLVWWGGNHRVFFLSQVLATAAVISTLLATVDRQAKVYSWVKRPFKFPNAVSHKPVA